MKENFNPSESVRDGSQVVLHCSIFKNCNTCGDGESFTFIFVYVAFSEHGEK